jgi:hypothetical protein
MLLSVISAVTAVLKRSTIATRFGVAFLGLFSSLAVYIHGSTVAGLVLLVTSSILLPCVLSSCPDKAEIESKKTRRFERHLIMISLGAGLGVSVLLNLDLIEIELIGLASVGLAALLFRESPLGTALGSVAFSQAIAVTISYWNPDPPAIFLFETCRLLCFAFGCLLFRRYGARLLMKN